MKYKTYAKKQTKYFKRYYNKVKAIFLICLFLVIGIDIIATSQTNDRLERVEQIVYDIDERVADIEQEDNFQMIKIYYNQDIEIAIREIAKEMGREEWSEYLIKLAYCESRLDPNALNDKGNNPADSYDRGLFQYNSYWQSHISDECAYDIDCATRNTIKMIEAGKQHRWVCNDYVKGISIEQIIK